MFGVALLRGAADRTEAPEGAADRPTPPEREEDLVVCDRVELPTLLRLTVLRDFAALVPRLFLGRMLALLGLPRTGMANRRQHRIVIVLFSSRIAGLYLELLARRKVQKDPKVLLDLVLRLGCCNRLPLHVGRLVDAAALQRDDMVSDVTEAGTGHPASRRAGILLLKFAPGSGVPCDASVSISRARGALLGNGPGVAADGASPADGALRSRDAV
jgi:hypothetical protein